MSLLTDSSHFHTEADKRPCDCGGRVFWRPTTVGTIYCVECSPPAAAARVKVMLYLDPARGEWVDGYLRHIGQPLTGCSGCGCPIFNVWLVDASLRCADCQSEPINGQRCDAAAVRSLARFRVHAVDGVAVPFALEWPPRRLSVPSIQDDLPIEPKPADWPWWKTSLREFGTNPF